MKKSSLYVVAALAGLAFAAQASAQVAAPIGPYSPDTGATPPYSPGSGSSQDDGGSVSRSNPDADLYTPPGQGPAIRGVRFNPEIYNAQGVWYGNSWLNAYDDADVRRQALEELRAVREITGLTHVAITLSANNQLAWPVPNAAELLRLVRFVNDANDEGFKVIVLAGHPCIVPNSAYTPANPGYNAKWKSIHVGGHKAGETVNGWQLYWDVPRCGDDNVAVAKQWYRAIVESLEDGIDDGDGVAYLSLLGHPEIPFAAETNLFYGGYPYQNYALEYERELIGYLSPRTDIPVAISTLIMGLASGEAARYAFLDILRAGVPGIFEKLDYLDVASYVKHTGNSGTSVDPAAIVKRLGGASSRKVVLSDFQWDGSALSQHDVAQWHFEQAEAHDLGGWWMWQYKDDGAQSGLRARGSFGAASAGWKQPVTDLVRSLFGLGKLGDALGGRRSSGGGGGGGSSASSSTPPPAAGLEHTYLRVLQAQQWLLEIMVRMRTHPGDPAIPARIRELEATLADIASELASL